MARTLQGQNYSWQLSDTPIGSGDAGEVFAVICKEQPDLIGVMKKPARIATGGTIQRQAGQIARESLALARLDGIPEGKAHPPRLLDEALPYTKGTANYFIVSEQAPGLDFSTMLSNARQSGKPFPRRVIIAVLDALFDLFSRAHKAGVLWNDVKLDHIYWHNPSSKIAVIDWGNAQFLDQSDEHNLRMVPRWEDYRQMVETLGTFLQQNAPELYNDLGWDEFSGQQLDSPRVSVLARRIAYQQQVMALRVMEYQSLINVVLNSDPSLDGFQKILEYQKNLQQIGAPWDQDGVLTFGRNLVIESLMIEDLTTTVKAVAMVWDLYDEDLDLPWHLLREYFRQTDLLTHPEIADLVVSTLNEQWLNAMWTLIRIARDSDEQNWWERIMPVVRQKALGLVTPPPLQNFQSIFSWVKQEKGNQSSIYEKLGSILKNWRIKGEDLEESPFDYEIMSLLEEGLEIPRMLRSEFKQSFAAGQAAIHELSKVWSNASFEALGKAIHQVAAWDPDRWGIIRMEEQVVLFQTWLQYLYEGPGHGEDPLRFIEEMFSSRPILDHLLGIPAWMNALLQNLNSVKEKNITKIDRNVIRKWVPWLLERDIPPVISHETTGLDLNLENILSHFQQHLKTWSDIEAGLALVKQKAPGYYPICKKLVDDFKKILQLNLSPEFERSAFEKTEHRSITEAYQTLQVFADWRTHIENKQLEKALDVLSNPSFQGWRMIEHAKDITTFWLQEIVPVLDAIYPGKNPLNVETTHRLNISLQNMVYNYAEIDRIWESIQRSGLHQPVLETLNQNIDAARHSFIKWRQTQEHSSDEVVRLMYHAFLDQIRQISNQFLLLFTHSRQAKLSLLTFGKGSQTTLTSKLATLENILEDLSAIETILVNDPVERLFPKWIEEFNQIITETTPEGRRQMVLSLSENHPLYNLLVQSVFSS